MNFDLSQVPFSTRGSYLAISRLSPPRAPQEGLWLRSVREVFESGPMLHIDLLVDGKPVPYTTLSEPACLILKAEDGASVSIAFDGPRWIRFRAESCVLQLSADGGNSIEGENTGNADSITQMTPAGENLWRMVMGVTSLHYVQGISGIVRAESIWSGRDSVDNRIIVDGCDDVAEVAISADDRVDLHAHLTTSFEQCVEEAAASFENHRASRIAVPERYADAADLAGYITWSCMVDPEGLLQRESMLMSKNWMTAVWSWDHCFNALALREGNPELAWDQFLTLFDHQTEIGSLPDFVNSIRTFVTYLKPPVHGWAFRQLWQAAPEFYTKERLQTVYTKLTAWTRYWFEHRDPYQTGLPVYYHGNDSGWDNSTAFMVGSPVATPELSALLVLQCDALADLAKALDNGEAERWRETSDALLQRLLNNFWKDNTWRTLQPAEASGSLPKNGDSLLPFVAVVLGEKLPKDVLASTIDQLSDPERFLTDHGLATESKLSPYYKDDGYWCGPIWAPAMMLIIDGLTRAGESGLAEQLQERFCNMCSSQGFAENFNAKTGEALRDRAYTWTASVFLELASRF